MLSARRLRGEHGLRPKSHPAPTAGSFTAQVPDACEAVEHRSLAVGMAVSAVPVAPGRDHHRPAGDRASLAPTWFPRLLALEVPPRRRAGCMARHGRPCWHAFPAASSKPVGAKLSYFSRVRTGPSARFGRAESARRAQSRLRTHLWNIRLGQPPLRLFGRPSSPV